MKQIWKLFIGRRPKQDVSRSNRQKDSAGGEAPEKSFEDTPSDLSDASSDDLLRTSHRNIATVARSIFKEYRKK